ncbi:MAG: ArnT family glycosyltransferase [Verrucomicrobiota bacterium]
MSVKTPWSTAPSANRSGNPSNGIASTSGLIPYLNKPPLYFWVSAALFQIGGPTPAMARLASILPGFAFILLLFAWLKNRGFPPALAAVATLLVALCPVFLEHATPPGAWKPSTCSALIGGCWTLDHTRLPTPRSQPAPDRVRHDRVADQRTRPPWSTSRSGHCSCPFPG